LNSPRVDGGESWNRSSGAPEAGSTGATLGAARGLAHKSATNGKSAPRRSSFSNSE